MTDEDRPTHILAVDDGARRRHRAPLPAPHPCRTVLLTRRAPTSIP